MSELQAIRELVVSPEMAEALRQTAPSWGLTSAQAQDLDLLVSGALFPLKGFVSQADHDAIMQDWRLTSGVFWPRPVNLRVDPSFFDLVEEGQDIGLSFAGEMRAVMSVTDRWQSHEGALLGGPVKGLKPVTSGPNALRKRFRDMAATRIVALWPGVPLADAGDLAAFYLCPADEDDRSLLLQAIIARNCGATEMVIPQRLISDRVLASADQTSVAIRAAGPLKGQGS